MFGSAILEVAIGVIFIFLLVSIICSAVREGLEAWLKTRAAYLERGIRELLHDPTAAGLAAAVYKHPLIHGLYTSAYKPGKVTERPEILANGGHLPSYIPARNFALALMDIAARGPDTDQFSSHPASPVLGIESVRANILNLRNPAVQRILLTAIDTAQGDLNKALDNVANWFDSGMDRVSGWYKRATQHVLFWIGFGVAIVLNINALTIADYLYNNDAARTAIVARAEGAAANPTFADSMGYAQARMALDSLDLPIGWQNGVAAGNPRIENNFDVAWFLIVSPALGWVLTAIAAMMGAPFWFDLLNKVMVIRSTVKPREKSPEEGSEDRQIRKDKTDGKAGGDTANQPAPILTQPPIAPTRAPPPQPPVTQLSTPDLESDFDGCELGEDSVTADEDLPAAKGGVA